MAQSLSRSGSIAEVVKARSSWRSNVIPTVWRQAKDTHPQQPLEGDLGRTLGRLFDNKGTIALAVLASLFLSLAYLWIATPKYTATASLFVDPRTRKVEEAVPASVGSDTTLLESQVAIITSESVLRKVVERLQLATDPEFSRPPSSLAKALAGQFSRGNTAATTDELALAALKKALKVTRAQKTYVLDIAATAGAPARAAQIAQAVVDTYFDDQTAAKRTEAQRSSAMIDSRLIELREQVRQAELRADDYKKANKILTSEGGVVGEQQLTRMNAELVASRAVAAESKARRDQIQASIKAGAEPDLIGDAARSGLMSRLREQYTQVARREASLASQLQPGHPLMADVRSQLNAVKGQITAELKRVATAAESEFQVAANREKELLSQIEKAKQEVAIVNTAQIRARELDQDVAASRELLKVFLSRAKETQQQEKTTSVDARVITAPVAPSAPSKPLPWLVLSLGLLTGLAAGSALALRSEKVNHALRSGDELGQETGLANIAVVPELKPTAGTLGQGVQFSDLLSALGSVQNRGGTEYRQAILRLLSKIKSVGRAGRPNTVMFVSPRAGSGNSATALAVAYCAAMSGERVLLVDATSTDPALSAVFAASLASSTTVILDSKEHLNKIITRDARSGLSFLPIALADLRDLKTQQRRRLVTGLNLVSQDYDWVFIDAGAILEDEAATTLLPSSSQIYVIGRAEHTLRSDMDEVMQILDQVRDRISGAILTFNRARSS